MRQPPDQQEQDEQQAIHPIEATHMTLLPLPAPTLEIRSGPFDAHPPTILRKSASTSGSIGNHQQGFLFLFVPAAT